MISLQQLLGREDKFYQLFEDSVSQCCQSAAALSELANHPTKQASLDVFSQSRHRHKAIHNEINETLCSDVVTGLEREDIIALAHSLYKIPKTIEKIGERLLMAPNFVEGFELASQAAMVERATDTLRTMVTALRKRPDLQEIKELNNQLQKIEGEADNLVLQLFTRLYHSEMEGRRVVYLKDLFELFEKVTDRCRDAGNVIVQILLKNS